MTCRGGGDEKEKGGVTRRVRAYIPLKVLTIVHPISCVDSACSRCGKECHTSLMTDWETGHWMMCSRGGDEKEKRGVTPRVTPYIPLKVLTIVHPIRCVDLVCPRCGKKCHTSLMTDWKTGHKMIDLAVCRNVSFVYPAGYFTVV